jgi:UDP-N-acetylglucosamine 2-epimerase (non-hydrolysing)
MKKVIVIDPVNHNDMINLLKECKFIISDSGGIQEEASFLNKRIIICRKHTERPEVLQTHGILCDSPDKLENIFNDININYKVDKPCPFGDGKSYKNVISILEKL